MRMFQHWRLVTAVLLAATPAVGQGSDPAGAEMLYRQGVDLMAANKWAEACPKLEDSFRLDSTGMTANALARCLEGQGKTASAWVKYQVAREFARKKGATGPERELTVKIDALEKQLAKLLIVVPKEIADLPGLIVKRDGIEVGRGSWGTGLPVDPGPHTLDAQATGKKAWSMQLDVPAGALATAQVAVLIDEAKPVGPVGPVASGPSDATTAKPPAPSTDNAQASNGSTQRVLGYVGIGLGVAGIVTGAVLYSGYKSKSADVTDYVNSQRDAANAGAPCDKQCTAEHQSTLDAKTSAVPSQTPMFLAFGIGGALAIGGVALVLTAPSSKTAFRFAPTLGQGGGGFVGVGTFLAVRQPVSRRTVTKQPSGKETHADIDDFDRGADDGADDRGLLFKRPGAPTRHELGRGVWVGNRRYDERR